jgi:hypothetical protein
MLMRLKTLVLAGAAVLAAIPFSPPVVFAQGNMYVAPDQDRLSDEKSGRELRKQRRQGQMSEDQASPDTKRRRMEGQPEEDQVSRDTKKRRSEGETSDERSSREIRREGKVVWDRDRHGERSRRRGGRLRYFHEGYYYATPWWTVGGIGCREGAGLFFGAGSIESFRLTVVESSTPIAAGAVANLGVFGLILTQVES